MCLAVRGKYIPLVRKYHVPIVVTGFEPLDLLQGIFMCVRQLEQGRAEVENQCLRSVQKQGKSPHRNSSRRSFAWCLENGAASEKSRKAALDCGTNTPFMMPRLVSVSPDTLWKRIPKASLVRCCAGSRSRTSVPHSAGVVVPNIRWATTMVSNEGACAAYYRYRRCDPEPTAAITRD